MKLLRDTFPVDHKKRKWVAIALTVVISWLLSVWAIYASGEYGLLLFLFIPVFIGFFPVVIYASGTKITSNKAAGIGFLTYGIYLGVLVLCAIEGLICIAMAAPLGLVLVLLGSMIGHVIMKNNPGSGPSAVIVLLFAIPAMAFVDKQTDPELHAVTTSIVIEADPQTVWKNVIAFPQLDEPTEFLFKAGIAYPVNAKIDGEGVGAVRHCNFTTGSFVEPVTVWNEPKLLRFDVAEQPGPMREISFWDVDAPHLHDYFVSKQGQFRLVRLPNGNTLLEGTTWYYHDIHPAIYWRMWSDEIIHMIHNRVLKHIKKNAENK